MAGHNVINPRYALTSITHFYTLMEKGLSVRNIKTIWFLSLQIIGKANLLLLLQSDNDRLLIYYIKLRERYAIN